MATYEDELKQMFARHGFVEPPLTDEQMERCREQVSLAMAYDIGCDVACCPDHTFEELLSWATGD